MNTELDPIDPCSADPGGDVLVVRAPDGSALLLPAAVGSLRGDAAGVAAEIQRHAYAIHREQLALDGAVRLGRELGLSWNVIGWCVGIDPGAARRRWMGEPEGPVRRRAARRIGAPRAEAAPVPARPEPEWS